MNTTVPLRHLSTRLFDTIGTFIVSVQPGMTTKPSSYPVEPLATAWSSVRYDPSVPFTVTLPAVTLM